MPDLRQRLNNKLVACGECRLFMGARNSGGYGVMTVETFPKRFTKLAHHISWFLEYGVWPNMLLHSCDRRSCVEVTHLREGTHIENQQDAVDRGRYAKHGYNARLTEDDVFDIRWLRGLGARNVDVAAAYGISQAAASQAATGQRWRHV